MEIARFFRFSSESIRGQFSTRGVIVYIYRRIKDTLENVRKLQTNEHNWPSKHSVLRKCETRG